MDFKTTFDLIFGIIIIIIGIIVLLKTNKLWGLIIIGLIALGAIFLDKLEIILENFLDKIFNNNSWGAMALFVVLLIFYIFLRIGLPEKGETITDYFYKKILPVIAIFIAILIIFKLFIFV